MYFKLYRCKSCKYLDSWCNDNICARCGEKTTDTVGRWVDSDRTVFKWYDLIFFGLTWVSRNFHRGHYEEKQDLE